MRETHIWTADRSILCFFFKFIAAIAAMNLKKKTTIICFCPQFKYTPFTYYLSKKITTLSGFCSQLLKLRSKLRWSWLTWFQIRSSKYETFNISLHKILLITYKILNGQSTGYLDPLIKEYHPRRAIQSSSRSLLCIPVVKSKTGGSVNEWLGGSDLKSGDPEVKSRSDH